MENNKNKATIIGTLISNFTFDHESNGKKYYAANVEINRISGNKDSVIVMAPEKLFDIKYHIGEAIKITGQFRSRNYWDGKKKRLFLYIYANEINLSETTVQSENNQIFLDGYICKNPIYRKTPLGREIADLLLAVNRPYGKTDYIPCIVWGRNAREALTFEVGVRVSVWGRVQSREYVKKFSDGKEENRIAYEISASRLEVTIPIAK